MKNYEYYINKKNKENSCMIRVSSYVLDSFINIEHSSENSIILIDNIPYIFLYNKEYKELKYDYYFIRLLFY